MPPDSNFRDEEIRQHLRQATSKKQNVDLDRRKLMQEIVTLAERGEIEELERQLEGLGIDLSPQRKALILERARNVRRNALRPR